MFQNRVLRQIFGPKWEEVTGDWKEFHSKKIIICAPYHMLLSQSNQGLNGLDVPHIGRREMLAGFW